MAINGISGKSVACLLLYCMGRLDFAVDANVLRVMTRLGWLKHIGASPADALAACDRSADVRLPLSAAVASDSASVWSAPST